MIHTGPGEPGSFVPTPSMWNWVRVEGDELDEVPDLGEVLAAQLEILQRFTNVELVQARAMFCARGSGFLEMRWVQPLRPVPVQLDLPECGDE